MNILLSTFLPVPLQHYSSVKTASVTSIFKSHVIVLLPDRSDATVVLKWLNAWHLAHQIAVEHAGGLGRIGHIIVFNSFKLPITPSILALLPHDHGGFHSDDVLNRIGNLLNRYGLEIVASY